MDSAQVPHVLVPPGWAAPPTASETARPWPGPPSTPGQPLTSRDAASERARGMPAGPWERSSPEAGATVEVEVEVRPVLPVRGGANGWGWAHTHSDRPPVKSTADHARGVGWGKGGPPPAHPREPSMGPTRCALGSCSERVEPGVGQASTPPPSRPSAWARTPASGTVPTVLATLLYATGLAGLLPPSHPLYPAVVVHAVGSDPNTGGGAGGALAGWVVLDLVPWARPLTQHRGGRALAAVVSLATAAVAPPVITWCLCAHVAALLSAAPIGETVTGGRELLATLLLYGYMLSMCAGFVGACRLDSALCHWEVRRGRRKGGGEARVDPRCSTSLSSLRGVAVVSLPTAGSKPLGQDGVATMSSNNNSSSSDSTPLPSPPPPRRTPLRLRTLGFVVGSLTLLCIATEVCTTHIVYAYYDFAHGGQKAIILWLYPSAIVGTALLVTLYARCHMAACGRGTTPATVQMPDESQLRSLGAALETPSREASVCGVPQHSGVVRSDEDVAAVGDAFYVSWLGLWIPAELSAHYVMFLAALLSFTTSLLYFAVVFRECLSLAAVGLASGVSDSPPDRAAQTLLSQVPLAEQYPSSLMLRPLAVMQVLLPLPRGGGPDGALVLVLRSSYSGLGGTPLSLSSSVVGVVYLYTQVALPIGIACLVYLMTTELASCAAAAVQKSRTRGRR